jgi:hypothetical protein
VSDSSPFGNVGPPSSDRFTPSATIPPGQTRLVRVSWVSKRSCLLGPATGEAIDTLQLRVKVGPFARNEGIVFGENIGLYGTRADCPDG